LHAGLGLALLLGTATGASAFILDLTLVGLLHEAQAEHADQEEFYDLVLAGHGEEAFEEAFELGDELFETTFNALDGGGAKVGKGQRFTRVPRADLTGAGEWATHVPERATGPNGQACNECHRVPFDDGAGDISGNVIRDPLHSGQLNKFIQRNTPHVFAPGAIQRLAEEMTEELFDDRHDAKAIACLFGIGAKSLSAKGVGFGTIIAVRTHVSPCQVSFNTSGVQGVATDLVVRPFQWKGSVAFIRDFNRGASHNELGMQAVEIAGDGTDGDGDGVVDEMTIGDQTALAVYLAAQPRPVSSLELNALGLLETPLTTDEIAAIGRGATTFGQIGCASCHRPSLTIDDPVFSEPSQNASFRDETFPAGQDPLDELVDPDVPVTFDLTADQPDNIIVLPDSTEVHLGSLEADGSGRGIVRLFGDLKRHNLGSGIAEQIDEVGTGASTFLTENLWGVGNTGPWMHDGRATTLTEAILEHGGEASSSRSAFQGLTTSKKRDVIAFLDSLVLFKQEE
jgi:hypothetical protein